MGSFLYGMANQLFGGGLSDYLQDWMTNLMGYVQTLLDNMGDTITVLSAIGCSLMIIYFFMDLTNQASKDMFSFEKLVIAFIRLLVAFAILLYAREIIDAVITFMQGFKDLLGGVSFDASGGAASTITIPDESVFEKEYSGIMGTIRAIGNMIKLLIPFLISWVCQLVGMFLTASTILQLIVRLVLSPLAIVQVFEEGTRSSGIRYIKGMFAEGMNFGVMLLILRMATYLGMLMMSDMSGGSVDWTSATCIGQIGWTEYAEAILISLLCVGGMAGASKITHDVMGA